MALKIEAFKKLDSTSDVNFTHYGTNDGDDFPDVEDITKYLEKYEENGVYSWVEMEDLRFSHEYLDRLTVEVAGTELEDNKVVFLRVTDDSAPDELPQYFYCTNFSYVSDQSYDVNAYRAECEMDYGATFGCKMHSIMKTTTEPILFQNKMCDRGERDGTNGGYIDYLRQPGLSRIGSKTQLLRDENEPNLSYTDGLYINSGVEDTTTLSAGLQSVGFPGYDNQFLSLINIGSNDYDGGVQGEDTHLIPNYYQHTKITNLVEIGSKNKTAISDSEYNSEGKYKGLVTRTGNNTIVEKDGSGTSAHGAMFRYIKDDKYISLNKLVYTTPGITDKFDFAANSTFDKAVSAMSPFYRLTYTSTLKTPIKTTDVDELINQFDDKLATTAYFHIKINNKDVYITDHLDNVLKDSTHTIPFDNANILVKFNKMTVYIPSDKKTVTFTPILGYELVTKDNEVTNVVYSLTLNFDEWYDGSITLEEEFKSNNINLYDPKTSTTEQGTEYKGRFNGEEVMLVPIKKGLKGQEGIRDLNNSSEVLVLGDKMTLGMPLNDIPPTVLSLALRRAGNENNLQPYGDLLAARERTKDESGLTPGFNPIDMCILNGNHKGSETQEGKTTEYSYNGQIPVIFNSLDYIPITIAISPSYNKFDYIIGGASFLNEFYRMMTSETLPEENTMENEPAMYNPNLGQGSYMIDGKNHIDVTADQLDLKKLVTTDGRINLNVNITDQTNYRLDINDIKNTSYPFTKSYIELTASDETLHPYSTENYNDWLQGNQVSKETSKNAELTIPNKGAGTNFAFNSAGNAVSTIAGGVEQGASGGPVGAIAGAALGVAKAGVKTMMTAIGLGNKVRASEEIGNNKGNGELQNRYASPSTLNPSGFEKGSLIFNDVADSKNDEYALFRTFRPSRRDLERLGDDVSTNGYPFMSECSYNDYDNRENFNIVNCNPANKKFYFYGVIKQQLRSKSTIFSQDAMVDGFTSKCLQGIRLFHVDFQDKNIQELIKGNVERTRLVPFRPFNSYVVYDNPTIMPKCVVTNITKDTMDYTNTTNNIFVKNNLVTHKTKGYTFNIPYKSLDSACTTFEQFKSEYEYMGVNKLGSGVVGNCKTDIYNYDFVNNTRQVGFDALSDIDFTTMTLGTGVTTEVLIDEANDPLALYGVSAKIDDNNYERPTSHRLGGKVTVTPTNTSLNIMMDEIDEYVFDSTKTYSSIEYFNRLDKTQKLVINSGLGNNFKLISSYTDSGYGTQGHITLSTSRFSNTSPGYFDGNHKDAILRKNSSFSKNQDNYDKGPGSMGSVKNMDTYRMVFIPEALLKGSDSLEGEFQTYGKINILGLNDTHIDSGGKPSEGGTLEPSYSYKMNKTMKYDETTKSITVNSTSVTSENITYSHGDDKYMNEEGCWLSTKVDFKLDKTTLDKHSGGNANFRFVPFYHSASHSIPGADVPYGANVYKMNLTFDDSKESSCYSRLTITYSLEEGDRIYTQQTTNQILSFYFIRK